MTVEALKVGSFEGLGRFALDRGFAYLALHVISSFERAALLRSEVNHDLACDAYDATGVFSAFRWRLTLAAWLAFFA